MNDNKVVMDRKTIKALGVSTRLDILKSLIDKEKTQSELAKEMKLSAPTIKEHLDELVEAGLLRKEDTDRKWKYYKVTFKGRRIVSPFETRVIFSLFASFLLGVMAIYQLTKKQFFVGGANEAMKAAPKILADQASVPVAVSTNAQASANYIWWIIIVIVIAIFILSLYYLWRRK